MEFKTRDRWMFHFDLDRGESLDPLREGTEVDACMCILQLAKKLICFRSLGSSLFEVIFGEPLQTLVSSDNFTEVVNEIFSEVAGLDYAHGMSPVVAEMNLDCPLFITCHAQRVWLWPPLATSAGEGKNVVSWRIQKRTPNFIHPFLS